MIDKGFGLLSDLAESLHQAMTSRTTFVVVLGLSFLICLLAIVLPTERSDPKSQDDL